jgi:hypothetical protein
MALGGGTPKAFFETAAKRLFVITITTMSRLFENVKQFRGKTHKGTLICLLRVQQAEMARVSHHID